VVKRGKLAGNVIGLVISRRCSGNEAHALGQCGKSREKRQRFELRHVTDRRAAERFRVGSAGTDAIGHEEQIEFRRFDNARQFSIVSEIRPGVCLGLRVTPRGNVMPGRIQKCAEFQLASTLAHNQVPDGSCPQKPKRHFLISTEKVFFKFHRFGFSCLSGSELP
jgi:hypothetical protein